MSERVVSPEELDKRLRVTRPGVWITLLLLLALISLSIVLLISKTFIVTEERPCIVLKDVVKIDQLLYHTYQKSFGKEPYFDIEQMEGMLAGQADGLGQYAFIIIRSIEDSEIAEGMSVNIDGHTGTVAFLFADASPYEDIKAQGLTDEDARSLGLSPGLSAWLCLAIFSSEDGTAVLEAGPNTARVIINEISVASLVFN